MMLVTAILVFDTAIRVFSTDFPEFDTDGFSRDAIIVGKYTQRIYNFFRIIEASSFPSYY